MAKHNIDRDISLIAKELGLEEDLLKPTGEGLKGSLKKIEEDLDNLEKKISLLKEEQKEINLKLKYIEKLNFYNKNEVGESPQKNEQEVQELPYQFNSKILFFYIKKIGRFLKPLLYALSIGILYFMGKALGIDIPLIP